MKRRAMLMCAFFTAIPAVSCGGNGEGTGQSQGSITNADSLAGTWTLTTNGGTAMVSTTVTIAQDSLSVTSPDFTLTATRTGNTLTFTDNDPPSIPANVALLTGMQTSAAFKTGILPFNLGGTWAIQAGPKGMPATVSCTLSVTATEIDGACQQLGTMPGPWFNFTTHKMSDALSSLGDFGGHWLNTWTTAGTGGGTYPCTIDFVGNDITTCQGGASNGQIVGNPLSGIKFTYDGKNTVSGSAQGWAEYSATR